MVVCRYIGTYGLKRSNHRRGREGRGGAVGTPAIILSIIELFHILLFSWSWLDFTKKLNIQIHREKFTWEVVFVQLAFPSRTWLLRFGNCSEKVCINIKEMLTYCKHDLGALKRTQWSLLVKFPEKWIYFFISHKHCETADWKIYKFNFLGMLTLFPNQLSFLSWTLIYFWSFTKNSFGIGWIW
jgi:hypothetical protein